MPGGIWPIMCSRGSIGTGAGSFMNRLGSRTNLAILTRGPETATGRLPRTGEAKLCTTILKARNAFVCEVRDLRYVR